jgi:hypothetical protein
MHHDHSDDLEAVPTALIRTAGDAVPNSVAAAAGPVETGEASFPASDPPACWTWDVAGSPPGSLSG